jgi:hypothetical protein
MVGANSFAKYTLLVLQLGLALGLWEPQLLPLPTGALPPEAAEPPNGDNRDRLFARRGRVPFATVAGLLVSLLLLLAAAAAVAAVVLLLPLLAPLCSTSEKVRFSSSTDVGSVNESPNGST